MAHDDKEEGAGGVVVLVLGVLLALIWAAGAAYYAPRLAPGGEANVGLVVLIAAGPALALLAGAWGAYGALRAVAAARRMQRAADRLLQPETAQALDAATLERWAKRQIAELNGALSATVERLTALDEAFRGATGGLREAADEAANRHDALVGDLNAASGHLDAGVKTLEGVLERAQTAMTKGTESAMEAAQLADERLSRTTAALDARTAAVAEAGAKAAEEVAALDDMLRRAVDKFESVSESALTSSEGLAARFDTRAEELLDAADRIDARRREFDDALWRGAETLSQTAERVAERAEATDAALTHGATTLSNAAQARLDEAKAAAGHLEETAASLTTDAEAARERLAALKNATRETVDVALIALREAERNFKAGREGASGLAAELEAATERQTRLLEDVVSRRFAKAMTLANQAMERAEALEREALRRMRRSHERNRAALVFTGRAAAPVLNGGQRGGYSTVETAPRGVERDPYPGVAASWRAPEGVERARAKRKGVSGLTSHLSAMFASGRRSKDDAAPAAEAWSWNEVLAVAGANKDDPPADPKARRAVLETSADVLRHRLDADRPGASAILAEDIAAAQSDDAAWARRRALIDHARELFLTDDTFSEHARRFVVHFEHDDHNRREDDPLGLDALIGDDLGRLYLLIGAAIGHLDPKDAAAGRS